MQFAAQHGKQRGLATAVGADKADALARVERHAGVVEQHLGAALEDKLVDSDHGGDGRLKLETVFRQAGIVSRRHLKTVAAGYVRPLVLRDYP
ncbi:hypothetical protein HpMS107_11890 [Helicobacter pylori]